MKIVKCTLPNASEEIDGVKFTLVGGAMVSDPVDAVVADRLASIPGYEVSDAKLAKTPEPKK